VIIIRRTALCARITLPTSHTSADPVPDVEDKAEDHKDPSPTGHSAANRVGLLAHPVDLLTRTRARNTARKTARFRTIHDSRVAIRCQTGCAIP